MSVSGYVKIGKKGDVDMEEKAELLLNDEQLAQFGEAAARSIRHDGIVSGRLVERRVKKQLEYLRAMHNRLSKLPTTLGAAQWVLDNWYLVQREAAEAAADFRRAERVRAVRDSGGERPLILALSSAMLEGTIADFTIRRMEIFLRGFQAGMSYTERELSLLISGLKLALTDRLIALCPTVESLSEGQEPEQALLEQGMERIFSALRLLISADYTAFLENASELETLLRQDPSGIYPLMDDDTRRRYRQELCRLARARNIGERQAAEKVLELSRQGREESRHVGWFLFQEPLGEQPGRGAGVKYIGAIVLSTLAISLFIGFTLRSAAVSLLLLLPVSDIVKNCVDFLVVRVVPPRHVHRLALQEGLPDEGRTLCVISALLTDEKSGPRYAALLERYRLSNRDSGENLIFGILADLPDSSAPMGTAGRRALKAAKDAVEGLNQKYGGGFYLLFRAPVFHAPDERYMGWERKRGAIVELVRLLKGRRTGLSVERGDKSKLRKVSYVITLDSDTRLNAGAALEMVGAMLHPLNRPKIDKGRKVVTSGHGLLQPRVGVDLEAASRSHFTRIFAGQGGVDPYGSASSDVYHDLFEEGTYTGKGIFDVDAFFTCLDRRFPPNTILSHDLLEGSYLRAGLLGDVELTDGYPYKITAYFARLHRWVRGDWQLLPWMSRRVKNELGERTHNPLGAISRWKIFDNLRRSLSPIFTLLALLLGMCLSGEVFAAAATAAILSAASNLLLSGAELAFRGGRGLRSRYHSTIIAGFGGVILQTLVQLILLPCHAWTCISAISMSLWRQLVSHRRLLDWVVSSDEERKTGGGAAVYYRRLWPAALIGLLAVLFARYPAGGAVGIVWMLSPLFAWLMSRPLVQHREAAEGDRAFLLHQGALIWRYFSDFLRPEDHWLPPDNWQAQPNPTLARRTSPTNIGLGLLAILAAADLDYCTRDQATEKIARMLKSVEALPRWNGHLYNWYDTSAMKPLYPRYVSTVDSGNLCGCLIALREGLYEWGEDKLAKRAEALSSAMEFSALYDEKRKLFYIGYDVEASAFTQGWYDLMASEARQASYIAVARGEVSPRHWRRLGRTLTSSNDYSGMASWTGTMFEYFMPHLLMPIYHNSLLYESLAFCIAAQKRRTSKLGVPWGISESSFYALDAALNYQYKAHGVQKLGLKRGLDSETVVSPYSSFLALPLAPGSAVHNLRRLRDMGMEGKYGLYEAVDFTPSRVAGEGKFQIVRSFMAHHLGMSLVAIDNAIRGNVMQERFMRDCSMSAFRELLQEKVPVGAEILKNPAREIPDKPGRRNVSSFQRAGEWAKGGEITHHLVSNGAYTVLCRSDGTTSSQMGSTELTRNQLIRPVSAAAESLSYRFSGSAAWSMDVSFLTLTHSVEVPEGGNGELREITVKNQGTAALNEEILFYLEPVLAKKEDYEAHPVFSKLFLESAFTGDGVVFTRRPRQRKDGKPAMAVLWDAGQVFFDTSRETALGRGGLRALNNAAKKNAQSTVGAVLDPCLLARVPVSLNPGECTTFCFSIAASDSAEDAVQAAFRLLGQPRQREQRRLDRLTALLKMTGDQTLQSFELLDKLIACSKGERPCTHRDLWPFGISGDLPIAVFEGGDEAGDWVRTHELLTRCGYPFDLVFLLDEGGDYRRPARTSILSELKGIGWEHQVGAKGGVHVVDKPAPVLCMLADTLGANSQPDDEVPPFSLEEGIPIWQSKRDGSFTFKAGVHLPPVGWSQILCNEEFGWFVDETGCGHLWLGNARENPLTPWRNDPLAIGGAEQFYLRTESMERSVFADADGLSCTVTYGPGYAQWEKEIDGRTLTVTAFVPMEDNVRYLILELAGKPCQIVYELKGKREEPFDLPGLQIFCTRPDEGGRSPRSIMMGQEAEKEVKLLLNRTIMHWNREVSSLKIHTPNQALDDYINGWALYQVIACRLYGRTSRYQNGGAYGFRDQLQDVCAVMPTNGELAAAQIRRASARQFEEGDVQHWWHPPDGKGVRTKISDDLLWLPYALCEYTEIYGETELLQEEIAYIKSPPLGAEHERYEMPEVSETKGTVYEHACRAVEKALKRGTGEHGLMLMGTGDWNDGMNMVGAGGKGESVWLTWFTSLVLRRFSDLCTRMGDKEKKERYLALSKQLAKAANGAWDGGWFLRGYYDDGSTLGSHADECCQLDSIAQSFAAFNEFADKEKSRAALGAAVERLYHKSAGVVQLFDPPFDGGACDPGYIRGYVPGVRENGGQYTHAAIWLAMACLRLDKKEDGYAILNSLLPANHDCAVYRAEPYVLAADVYWNPDHMGRGGWSWYTGAAGWYYRSVVREVMGIQVRRGKLHLHPKLPEEWQSCGAVWRTESMTLRIEMERGGEKSLTLDGSSVENGIDLKELTGEHTIRFTFV